MTTRTVAIAADSIDYLEDGRLVARLSNAHKIDATSLTGYENDWRERGQWPLAATHCPVAR